MGLELTKDSDKLICLIYRIYLEERKAGNSKTKAKMLGSSQNIHRSIVPSWTYEDVDETCKELSRVGLLNCSYADNVVSFCYLSDSAIIYMENRFANGLRDLLGYLSKIAPAIL